MNESSAQANAAAAVRERLLKLVSEILGRGDEARNLSPQAPLAELGMSSIKMVNLMLAVEAEFDLSIPQQDITPDNFRSVNSIETLLQRLLALRP